jgi:hypothetical protein
LLLERRLLRRRRRRGRRSLETRRSRRHLMLRRLLVLRRRGRRCEASLAGSSVHERSEHIAVPVADRWRLRWTGMLRRASHAS